MAKPATILVVDDDDAVTRPLIKYLNRDGFTPIEASKGQEALAYLRGGSEADVILLDLRMPVMDGWAFRREQLRDPKLAPIPVVVFSGATDGSRRGITPAAVESTEQVGADIARPRHGRAGARESCS